MQNAAWLGRRLVRDAWLSLLLILTLNVSTAWAAGYPDHPITFVSAYAPGATNDFLTRSIAYGVAKVLKGSSVVENRPGANGIVGTGFVARSNPDGYTLLMGNSASHGINPSLYPNLQYDALKDFRAVGMVASVPIVVVVNKDFPADNLKQLIAYGHSHPGKLAFGSSGIGGAGHLAGEAFIMASKIDMVHAPYKGDAPAVADTLGGQIPLCFVALSSATPMMNSGKLKIIAVASKQRLASLPNVPTIDESGYPNMEFAQWFAVVAPAKTPQAIIDTLNGAMKVVLSSADTKKSFDTQGAEPIYLTPQQTDTFIKSEIERFGTIIHALHLQAN